MSAPARSARPVGRPRANPRSLAHPPREEILRAAGRLFAKQGYAATSTYQIAKAAGLRQPSLFHYFSRKEDILGELLHRTLRPQLEFLQTVLAEPGRAALKLYRLIRSDVLQLLAPPYDVGAIVILPEVRPPKFKRFWAERHELIAGFEALVRDGVREGDLISSDPVLSANVVFGTNEGALGWYRRRSPHTAEEVANGIADVSLRALLRDPAELDAIRRESSVD